jgi:hypothetical protein
MKRGLTQSHGLGTMPRLCERASLVYETVRRVCGTEAVDACIESKTGKMGERGFDDGWCDRDKR